MQKLSKYVQGKSLWFYVVLYAVFVYLFIANLSFSYNQNSNPITGVMYFIEFGVHEASHLVFGWLPPILVAAAGSIGEIMFTLLIVVAFLKYRAYFGVIFGILWFMLACRSAGIYMSDARSQLVPLIGPTSNPQHDWHFVFSELGWLQQDTVIGGAVSGVGIVIGVTGLILGAVLLFLMAFGQTNKPTQSQ